MALSAAVQHSRKRSQTITWKDDDGAAVTLTGATITGIIDRGGTQTAITGVLTVTGATTGVFTWAYSAADVAQAGSFHVQFRAKYADSLSEISYRMPWRVLPAFAFELVSASTSPSASASPSASPSPSS